MVKGTRRVRTSCCPPSRGYGPLWSSLLKEAIGIRRGKRRSANLRIKVAEAGGDIPHHYPYPFDLGSSAANCSSPRWTQHRLGKNGSAGPNCTVLTIDLAKCGAEVVIGLMQTAQREVQKAGRGYPAKRAARRQPDPQSAQQTWLRPRRTLLL
jgi:hypothetical protein